ncbi:type II toxin-antitoxin system HicA family toxin [Nocardia miyunensis]|uniref:type II toxin-antitoxin system HicA family toxin n=1 Tax=Nocardia miyunensis TaxID=282684 RepID=UPI000A078D5F|nr:type II toxin-antitoxin system HicA family toxin [Nocardia miyunensis]
MPPTPSVRGIKVVRALERAGFKIDRVKGSHHLMKHPDGRSVPVPVHNGKDIPKGTLRSIAIIAQMSVDELIELL